MANEKQIVMMNISTIQRALGIIEGVMLLAEPKAEQALATAVEMIDEALRGAFEDGK